MKQRNLDNIYFRVKRDGEWTNRCFTDLRPSEQEEQMEDYGQNAMSRLVRQLGFQISEACYSSLSAEEMRPVARRLACLLRDIGDQYGIEGEVAEDE